LADHLQKSHRKLSLSQRQTLAKECRVKHKIVPVKSLPSSAAALSSAAAASASSAASSSAAAAAAASSSAADGAAASPSVALPHPKRRKLRKNDQVNISRSALVAAVESSEKALKGLAHVIDITTAARDAFIQQQAICTSATEILRSRLMPPI